MAIPRSVKKQADEAKKLQTALNTDPAINADLIKKQTDELEQNPVIKAEETPNLEQPVIPEKGEEPKSDDTDWEKRFKGLQTRYNREVPELRGQLSTTEEALKSVKNEILTLKDSIQHVEETPVQNDIVLTDEEREQFGEGWIDMMSKVAEQTSGELAKQVVSLQKELAEVKQGITQVSETVVVNTERDFFSTLGRKVKAETGRDWKDINEDDNFHNFLATEVPYTGRERQEFLADARKNLDVESAAQFFIDYAGPSSSEKELSPPNGVPKVPEELITPDTAGGNLPPIEEKKVYTSAEIDTFYADKRKGKYKDPIEARKIEEDILLAGREGRIVNRRLPAYA